MDKMMKQGYGYTIQKAMVSGISKIEKYKVKLSNVSPVKKSVKISLI